MAWPFLTETFSCLGCVLLSYHFSLLWSAHSYRTEIINPITCCLTSVSPANMQASESLKNNFKFPFPGAVGCDEKLTRVSLGVGGSYMMLVPPDLSSVIPFPMCTSVYVRQLAAWRVYMFLMCLIGKRV